jgi:hypothetical protein
MKDTKFHCVDCGVRLKYASRKTTRENHDAAL